MKETKPLKNYRGCYPTQAKTRLEWATRPFVQAAIPLKPKQGLTPEFLLRGPSHGSVCGFL
jgi:hypothetical protein